MATQHIATFPARMSDISVVPHLSLISSTRAGKVFQNDNGDIIVNRGEDWFKVDSLMEAIDLIPLFSANQAIDIQPHFEV